MHWNETYSHSPYKRGCIFRVVFKLRTKTHFLVIKLFYIFYFLKKFYINKVGKWPQSPGTRMNTGFEGCPLFKKKCPQSGHKVVKSVRSSLKRPSKTQKPTFCPLSAHFLPTFENKSGRKIFQKRKGL